MRKLLIVCVPVFFETGSTHQLLFAEIVTFATFGAYATLMPYAKREDTYYALSSQAVIFFCLVSSLAQPMGAGMDAVLTTLTLGFTALGFALSPPRACKTAACIIVKVRKGSTGRAPPTAPAANPASITIDTSAETSADVSA